jgi:3-deoxy-D-manno-octulosonic-acid transferase
LRVLLTHGTATGRAEGQALLRPGDVQVWQPWDSPDAVRRFFSHFKPRLGVLMETEIWPGLLAGARHAGVPMVLANARLSEKSLAQAQRLPMLAGPAYAGLHRVLAQTEADAQHLAQLGAAVFAVVGNLKFDAQPDAAQLALAQVQRARLHKPVLVFASSREGEEARFLDLLKARSDWAFQPLIVPRHPQRFDEVAQAVQAAGLALSRRSQWGADLAAVPEPRPGTVWLGDSLGEMALYYALSELALLGGSFVPLGGQNLIEAAACACPVVMGPHTFNFSEAAQRACAEGAAVRVQDLAEALRQAQALCGSPQQAQLAQAALAFSARHRGAAQASVQALQQVLNGRA